MMQGTLPRLIPMRALIRVLTAVAMALSAEGSIASAESFGDASKVKAAFIYQFTQFMRWPVPGGADPGRFDICTIGKTRLPQALKPLERKQSSPFSFRIRVVDATTLESCRVLYVGEGLGAGELQQLLCSIDQGILTISSQPGFARRGGMIGFVIRDSRVRIQLNRHITESAGITISAKLLEVVELVGEPFTRVDYP